MKFHQPINMQNIDQDALTGRLFFEPSSFIDKYYAFSLKTKIQMYARAGDICELTGKVFDVRECAHLNHNRQADYYDDVDNGLLVSLAAHLAQHVKFKGNASAIGLPEHHNNFAIAEIAKRLTEYKFNRGLWRPSTFAEERLLVRREIDENMPYWDQFYASVES